MGKPTGKKKTHDASAKPSDVGNAKHSKKAFDEDTTVFINMSQELKDEGNKLFQKRDYEGAILKYEKAVKLLPKNHIDVAYLRSSMAACYMQFGLGEYPKAINECNLALYVSPRYSKALLRRSKCFEELNRLDLAWRDVNVVIRMEPNNLSALEIYERLKKLMEEKGISYEEKDVVLDDVEVNNNALKFDKVLKEKAKKKKNKGKGSKAKDKVVVEEKMSAVKDKEVDVKTVEDKEVVRKSVKEEKVVSRTVKLLFGEDIRWAQIPLNCSIGLVRDVIRDRFPGLKAVLVKYRDREGDLVTVTTTDELRMVEVSGDSQGSLRLYVVEVDPEQEPVYEGMDRQEEVQKVDENLSSVVNGEEENIKNLEKDSICVEDWIIQFARLFKNHVGIESDSYLDLHGIGMKLYSEAMEDTVTGEDAQELFDIAADKFQEMAALAMFNWGNVHMSRARKRSALLEDGSSESVLDQVKSAYEWAQKEYLKAGMRYEEALRIKPDFYEGYLALGHQNFEQAKLCWYYAVGNKVALESGPSSEVLQLYNKAEDGMEKGIQLWEEMEEQRLNGLSKFDKYKDQLQKMGLDGLVKDVAADEAAEQVAEMRSQVYRLWGILLYERSIVEYKLELPTWDECLEVAIEKFELAGTSPTDIAVMIKNHCSNETALEGFGFKIDEIVQAWNEMYDAESWLTGVPSFRLEPLLRRRVPKLHSIMEHL